MYLMFKKTQLKEQYYTLYNIAQKKPDVMVWTFTACEREGYGEARKCVNKSLNYTVL